MRLGFNSNLQVRDTLYRVQTEERGSGHPCIDTIVLSHGQVLHHRNTSSEDLLTSEAANEAMLRARVEQQHRDIIQALQTGTLPLGVQPQDSSGAIEVRLRNAQSWLLGGNVALEVEVCSRGGSQPIAGADVAVVVEGVADEPLTFLAQTDTLGRAWLRFPLPKFANPETAALVIQARTAKGQGRLRYRLKPNAAGSPHKHP